MSFQLQTMRLVIPGVFFLTLGQIGSALESNLNEERRFMYQNQPSKSHQLPFDQGVQIHIQRFLALCEFHYCDFSKKSLNLPYANFWLMRMSSNAIFFPEPKVALGKDPLYKKAGLL